MIGQRSVIDPAVQLGDELREMRARLAELERASRGGFAIVSDASQSIPSGANTAIAGFSDEHNPSSWTITGSGIQTPSAGLYQWGIQVDWLATTAGARIIAFTTGPGARVNLETDGNVSSNMNGSTVDVVAASTTIGVTVFQNTGGNVNVAVRLWVARIA